MGAILGTLIKNRGYIKFLGEEMEHLSSKVKEHIGVVFDNMNFSHNLDVMKLSKVFGNIYEQWDDEKYFYYINLFSLPTDKKVKTFSRGMSMKLSLAVALSHDAKLLFLDEATAGLDPVAREEILEVFLDIVKDKSRSILLSSHITSDIEKVADYLIFIKNGEIVLQVNKKELLNNYAVVQCSPKEFNDMDKREIIAFKHIGEDFEVLISNKKNLPASFYQKDFSIDDITMLLMKGEK